MLYTYHPRTISIRVRVSSVVFDEVVDTMSFLGVCIPTDEDGTDMLTTTEFGITGVGTSGNDGAWSGVKLDIRGDVTGSDVLSPEYLLRPPPLGAISAISKLHVDEIIT